ncbi:hypothetical protein [Anaerophilus nitritogenes]|uniref:hypothetical protein n=1 Tax=Anaerophilus nitritogenes TaxID=2498136 RepID=UPI0013E9E84D|nr:hypothetical protein [Anaerophilus nitritogenes]
MKNYNQLTEIDKQEIINLFYEGLEFTSIKDKLEISNWKVNNVKRNALYTKKSYKTFY